MILNDFSYNTYSNLLNKLFKSAKNLCFRDFSREKPEDNFLLLRHDVDFSPEAALQMAELEANMGIKATYFILFNSPYYNLFSKEYILFPRKLVEMGHEIGLHYDLEVLEALDSKNPMEILKLESDILSRFVGLEIKSIAMHNPSLSGHDLFRETEFINAYDDNYTKKISYFSDSCGAWRDEFVACIENNNIPSQMQLLIHPIFWGPASLSRWKTLDYFVQSRINNLSSSAKLIKDMWSNHTNVIEHDKRNNG